MDKASLKKYNSFLSNSGINETVESFINEQFKEKKFLEKKEIKKTLKIMDLGCGSAFALKEIKAIFKKKVEIIGLDLKEFPKENSDKQIISDFNSANLSRFNEKIDLIFSFRSFHLFGNNEDAIKKILSLLAFHGKAILLIRITEVRDGEISFAGNQSNEDIEFLMKLVELKMANIENRNFFIESKKTFMETKALLENPNELKENEDLKESKILTGLSLIITRIR